MIGAQIAEFLGWCELGYSVRSCVFSAVLLGVLPFGVFSQTHRVANPPSVETTIVAGIVGPSGSVQYLPHVNLRFVSKAYSDLESHAQQDFRAAVEQSQAARENELRTLSAERKAALADAKARYNSGLIASTKNLQQTPISLTTTCIEVDYSGKVDTCKQYSIRKVTISTAAQALFLDPSAVGSFDPATFRYTASPYAVDASSTLRAIPLDRYLAVPEFAQELGKLQKKERDKEKSQQISADGQRSVIEAFLTEWNKAAQSRDYLGDSPRLAKEFGGLSPIFFEFFGKELEADSAQLIKLIQESVLKNYVAIEDQINSEYDAREAKIDASYKNTFATAKEKLAADLRLANKTYPTLFETMTSLSGEAVVKVPPNAAFLYGEDTTSDRHLSWKIALGPRPLGKLELTSDNALNISIYDSGLTGKQSVFPSVKDMSALEKDEYEARYGSRLTKTWKAVVTDDLLVSDHLTVVDSPEGFAFEQTGTSTNTYNTLRMTDNQIASRLFTEAVAPYLLKLPASLDGIGASGKFQAAELRVSCSKKDFLEKYAVGSSVVFTFVFKISDIGEFAAGKIDSQQLLDRSTVNQDNVGRIAVKLTSS